MPSPSSTDFTDCTRICSRTMSKSLGSVQPSRTMLIVTLVPGLPRMRLTASASCMSLVDSPSILMIRSPVCSPAR